MRALWMDHGHLDLRDVPVPTAGNGCLIRVSLAGICGTDLHMRRGYADFTGIPGHEFVGIVEAAGAEAGQHWVGQRVVGDINLGCGTCAPCLHGAQTHCHQRRVLGIRGHHGAFAEYLTLPAANLHLIPDTLPDRVAVFTEPAAAGCRILEQVRLGPECRVAVLGDGRMGLLTAQVVATAGAAVVLVGRHDARLDLARRLGLETHRSTGAPLPAADRFDVVVDLTGRGDGLEYALGYVRPLGTIVMKTTAHGTPALATWPIVVDEVTIVGSRCGPFAPALALLAAGTVRTEPLVEGVYPLRAADEAFGAAERGLKVLFDISAP